MPKRKEPEVAQAVRHECQKGELEWSTEPTSDGDSLYYEGKCLCGKVYQQIFTAEDGLWDVQEEEWVYFS